MTIQAFSAELKKALIARGFSESEAIGSVTNITSKLNDESRRAIESYDVQTIGKIADRIVMLVNGSKATSMPAHNNVKTNSNNVSTTADEGVMMFDRRRTRRMDEQRSDALSSKASIRYPDAGGKFRVQTESDDAHIRVRREEHLQGSVKKSDTARMDAIHSTPIGIRSDISDKKTSNRAPTQRIPAIRINDDFTPDEYGNIRERAELTAEGKKKYVRTVVMASPIIAICAILFFSCFGVFIASAGILCAVIFAVFVAEIIAGCILTLFSLIFGIVQLFSAVPIGIYEIGISFIIAGVALALSVLTYKLSTGVLPYVIKRVCTNLKSTLYRLSEIADDYKRRCNDE